MAVKMRPVDCRTKRPRGALLQLDTDLFLLIVEDRREARRKPAVSGIPLVKFDKSNLWLLETEPGTVFGR